ncbi:propanediol utilization polyhedral body protein PduT [Klebsiella pneumoniae subsp. ozaenae]|uniref:Propanediol utilization polyhedral body protein PduT n=1 Tax=Klebsiella pneumoniae subsp. ozaenae TaxID=574 RepID=A0A377Z5D3_KLEPO|nr:propanediol utilization polyhedral body protein PduT [Klebsiella pneumoniae subsp. ozaenae]
MTQAIGILELTSIARGMELGDVMLKSANVQLLLCRTLCPGKFLLMLGGDVGAVQQAIAAGTARAGEMLVDSLVLANIHPSVLPAISGLNVVGAAAGGGDRRNLERGGVHQRRRPRGESGQRHPGAGPYGVWYRRQMLHGGGG